MQQQDEYGIETVAAVKEQLKTEEAQYTTKPKEVPTTQAATEPKKEPQTVDQKRKQIDDKLAAAEEIDEEDMYGEATEFKAIDQEEEDGFVFEAKTVLRETIVIFRGKEFLLYDFGKQRSWQVGDLQSTDNISIPEDASVVMVEPEKHRTNEMQAILTGGCSSTIEPVNRVLAFNFDKITQAGDDIYSCATFDLAAMPSARFMHQSAIVLSDTGFQLMVFGGKESRRNWTNSVISLDLKPYFKQGLTKTNEDGTTTLVESSWRDLAPMLSARANFAILALKNIIYVYGGISGAESTAGREKYPTLANPPIERYTIASNSWESFTISMVTPLAAFSWCRIGETAQIAILGGTNGDILTEDFFIIDFDAETVMQKQTNFEFNTGMGKLMHVESRNSLVHLGGFNSEGDDFELALGTTEWKKLHRDHSVVLNEQNLELTSQACIYFD